MVRLYRRPLWWRLANRIPPQIRPAACLLRLWAPPLKLRRADDGIDDGRVADASKWLLGARPKEPSFRERLDELAEEERVAVVFRAGWGRGREGFEGLVEGGEGGGDEGLSLQVDVTWLYVRCGQGMAFWGWGAHG